MARRSTKDKGSPVDGPVARNMRRLARLDLPGGGQVVVAGHHAYVGHLNPPHGTTIIDIADARRPKVVATVEPGDPSTHTHKVRVVGDLMFTNYEQYNRYYYRRGDRIPGLRRDLAAKLKRPPTDAELAQALTADLYVGGKKKVLTAADIDRLDAARERGYPSGGFRIYDVSDKSKPRLITHQRTHSWGCHRFDVDDRYIYVSTEWPGYVGNILVIYDIRDPAKPAYVSHWALPGQHVAGGEAPTWKADDCRVHHGLRLGDEIWVGCLWGGFYVVDVSDISRPRTLAGYNYHPPFPEPTHTAMALPFPVNDRRVAVVADESQVHHHGQPHAPLWIFDVSRLDDIKPLSVFTVSELESPWSAPPAWFGCHQFQEHFRDTRVYAAWFAGGLRVVDIADPERPEEIASFVPEPGEGQTIPGTNDVDVDDRGLVVITDRYRGFDILEMTS